MIKLILSPLISAIPQFTHTHGHTHSPPVLNTEHLLRTFQLLSNLLCFLGVV